MQLNGNVSSTGVSGGISFEGAGSEVTIEPTLLSGTKIADYTIDDVPGSLYCLPATDIEVDPDLVSGTKIATITIDGADYDLYAPAGSTISYTDNTTAGYRTKIGSLSINGVSTDINMKSVGYTDLTGGTGVQIGGISVGDSVTPVYAPAGGVGGIDYSTSEQDTGLKWIDGSTVYQISFEDTLTVGYTKTISNDKIKIISVEDFAVYEPSGTLQYLPLPYYFSNSDKCNSYIVNGVYSIATTASFVASYTKISVTIKYVKVV